MFLKNVNTKRLGMLIGAVFLFQFASDFLIHQVLLKQTYAETASLWRKPEEIQALFPFMLLGQLILAIFFSLIFVKGYEGKGLPEGVRFGILAGGLLSAPLFIEYAVSPLTCGLVCSWLVAGMVQAMGAGMIASLVYRR